MDSESKNKNSQTILTKRQSETESTTDADLVTAFPDPVHVAKNDRASFANWYRLVDGYRVNLVLLRTARTDPILKEILLPHLSLAACRNRDRMDVDTVVEICSPEVRKGLQRANWIVQTLVPEVYRLYDGNKEGVLKIPVSVCPASWGTLLIADKEKGKILSARLHYPVDVVEIVSGLICPVAITYRHGLLLIADVGKQQILCFDLTGDHFLNPEKMTVKQLRKALKDRRLLPPGNNSKKGELQKALKSWMDANSTSDRNGQTKLHTVEIVNQPTIQAAAVVFSEQGTDNFYAAEMSEQVHEISLTINGLNANANVLRSIDVTVGSLFGIVRTNRDSELYVSSSAVNGGLFRVNLATGHCECVLSNGSEDLQCVHGICAKMDGTVVMVDRGDHKVKEFKEDLDEVRVLAGSGRSGTKDGSETSASFSQPTAVCCEEGADTVYVLDTSIGRLKMITSTLALTTFLENLWKFLTAFQLTSEDVSGLEEAIDLTQSYYSFLEKASLKVQQIKGSTAKTQGPDGTLSSSTLNSVEMILLGLNRLKEDVIHLNPEYLKDIEVRSLLTLFVENFFSSMRGGNTITPTVLDFCRRFPRCTNELLKRVTKNPFNYFTNPKASYYVQPSMKDVLIQFSELAKLPKPSKGSLAPKQITELRQWASINGKSVRQNTTRNFSTKDKPGTFPLNVYEASPPKENTVDFTALLGESSTDGNKEREDSGQDRADIEILHPNGTFVLFPHICRPGSLPTSTFYIVKLLEDLPDDDHFAHVRTEWYAQDLVDPLLFTTTEKEYTVSKDGIKGIIIIPTSILTTSCCGC